MAAWLDPRCVGVPGFREGRQRGGLWPVGEDLPDAGLRTLKRIEAPLFDMEIRGVPALQFMGGQVWTD